MTVEAYAINQSVCVDMLKEKFCYSELFTKYNAEKSFCQY